MSFQVPSYQSAMSVRQAPGASGRVQAAAARGRQISDSAGPGMQAFIPSFNTNSERARQQKAAVTERLQKAASQSVRDAMVRGLDFGNRLIPKGSGVGPVGLALYGLESNDVLMDVKYPVPGGRGTFVSTPVHGLGDGGDFGSAVTNIFGGAASLWGSITGQTAATDAAKAQAIIIQAQTAAQAKESTNMVLIVALVAGGLVAAVGLNAWLKR